jgi:hypothetical protein
MDRRYELTESEEEMTARLTFERNLRNSRAKIEGRLSPEEPTCTFGKIETNSFDQFAQEERQQEHISEIYGK